MYFLIRVLIAGPILPDLSKVYDCISHDLLKAKIKAHVFDKEALSLMYSYLKGTVMQIEKGRINDCLRKYSENFSFQLFIILH